MSGGGSSIDPVNFADNSSYVYNLILLPVTLWKLSYHKYITVWLYKDSIYESVTSKYISFSIAHFTNLKLIRIILNLIWIVILNECSALRSLCHFARMMHEWGNNDLSILRSVFSSMRTKAGNLHSGVSKVHFSSFKIVTLLMRLNECLWLKTFENFQHKIGTTFASESFSSFPLVDRFSFVNLCEAEKSIGLTLDMADSRFGSLNPKPADAWSNQIYLIWENVLKINYGRIVPSELSPILLMRSRKSTLCRIVLVWMYILVYMDLRLQLGVNLGLRVGSGVQISTMDYVAYKAQILQLCVRFFVCSWFGVLNWMCGNVKTNYAKSEVLDYMKHNIITFSLPSNCAAGATADSATATSPLKPDAPGLTTDASGLSIQASI